MRKTVTILYECMMILLVIITIITIWIENTYNSTVNWVVWAIFFADFMVRLFMAKPKWEFIKHNPFLLIAVIPFDQFFQLARIVRLVYFFRIKQIAKYYITPYARKLTYQSLSLLIVIVLTFLLIETIIVWRLEKAIVTIFEGLYVVFGHLLFFGHRIFIINNTLSIWMLTITSILGVVFQGLALQWLFTKAEAIFRNLADQKDPPKAS